MNKTLDKSLWSYIKKMTLYYTPFGDRWYSSAKNLESELRARGIVLQQKLYYEYKLPNGDKPNEFMKKLIIESFLNDFYLFYARRVLKDKSLGFFGKLKVFMYVWHNRRKVKNLLKQYEQEIRKINPELSKVKIDTSSSLVYGATFGFAPQEIEYFADVKNRDMIAEAKIREILEKQFGIKLTYILAPKTAKSIIIALKQKLKYNTKEK